MEVIANNHSKRYPIELTYRETVNKTVSFVFSLENAKKLLSDLDTAIKEIEEQNDKRRKKEALQTSIPELRPKFKVGDIIAHNFRKRYPIWYEPDCFIVSVDEKGYNLKDGGFIGFGVQDDYFLVGRFNPNPTDSDAVPVRFEEEDGEKYPFVSYKDHLQKPAEWGEEDEWKRKELIQYLEEKGDYRTVWMTWLKSFRPRLSDEEIKKIRSEEYAKGFHDAAFGGKAWKPSEEQKEALEYVIRDYREDGCNPTANYLQEILDHLKNM